MERGWNYLQWAVKSTTVSQSNRTTIQNCKANLKSKWNTKTKQTKLQSSCTADSTIQWTFVLNIFKEVSTEILGVHLTCRKEWISDKTWEFIGNQGDINNHRNTPYWLTSANHLRKKTRKICKTLPKPWQNFRPSTERQKWQLYYNWAKTWAMDWISWRIIKQRSSNTHL